MIDYQLNKVFNSLVLISFTIIGLLISVLASFEAAFKYAEKAAGLRMLSGEVQSNLRESMSKNAVSFHSAEFNNAMISLQKTIEEQNNKRSEIYSKSASFGLDLASETNAALPKNF